jgi:hypothetical protein
MFTIIRHLIIFKKLKCKHYLHLKKSSIVGQKSKLRILINHSIIQYFLAKLERSDFIKYWNFLEIDTKWKSLNKIAYLKNQRMFTIN